MTRTLGSTGGFHVHTDTFTAHAWFYANSSGSSVDEPDLTIDLRFNQTSSSPYLLVVSRENVVLESQQYNGWNRAIEGFLDRLTEAIEAACG